ncbi:MAG: hypothetical protein MK132_16140 [Lentisphaerales bacterium]|nr:hypothetical protein [Lentisphaerales bacterium]
MKCPNKSNWMPGILGDLGEKIYATILSSLMLTVNYRYLPSNKSVAITSKKKPEPIEEELNLID